MNNFQQISTYLLGTDEAVKELAGKEKARILIVSDSHEDYGKLEIILRQFGRECDALVFCGDGAKDLELLSMEASSDGEYAQCIPPVIGFVGGNCDPDLCFFSSSDGSGTMMRAQVRVSCTMEACGHKLFFTHGHRFSLYEGMNEMRKPAVEEGCDIVCFGHTHVAGTSMEPGKILFINPGSCARPRCAQPNSFAVLELGRERGERKVTFYQVIPGMCLPFIPE